ncbi:hypothetical protein MVEN_02321700 [Mycena venus]|uniref:Uncharacterized protein n=1 Tax=Mycena venus TaxID=2733690 RepID=A0A8H6X520_9AGAR|nr:hypothetical protein MVEN_02321700 [Mycena venus]
MLPPRPPPPFSPPPVPNVQSHNGCINNELSMEVKRLKAKCRHLNEALLTRKSPNLELQFLFVDILYLQFIEECNIQGINSLGAVVFWLNPPQEATNEGRHHTQASGEINQLIAVDRTTKRRTNGSPQLHKLEGEKFDGLDSNPGPQATLVPVLLSADACTTPELKKAKSALQSFITRTFRSVCGVSNKESWPDPADQRFNEITNQEYVSPVFAADVKDIRNQRVFIAVADQALNDLKDPRNHPKAVRTVNATWDHDLIHELAENSFNNLKRDWKKQNNPEAHEKGEIKKRASRRLYRRKTKLSQIKKVVEEFLCNARPQSYASGPDSDDDTYENEAAWKRGMAKLSGVKDVTQNALAKMKFLEVITPDWRADELSDLFHALHQLYTSNLEPQEANKFIYTRVRDTGRRCHRIPAHAPYDVGISSSWLDKSRADPSNVAILHDWGKYGNPNGLDVAALKAATDRALERTASTVDVSKK